MKMTFMTLVPCAMVMVSGCIAIKTYTGPSPVKPRQLFFLSPVQGVTVDSLRPTFKWRETHPGARYELAIWENLNDEHDGGRADARKGPLVCSVKDLRVTEYTIGMDLLPDESYYWSVREVGGEWMNVNFFIFGYGGYARYRNWPFLIRTPSENWQQHN
jgi:hypothetical protein